MIYELVFIKNLIKYFGAIFKFLYWNFIYNYRFISESRFKVLYAKGYSIVTNTIYITSFSNISIYYLKKLRAKVISLAFCFYMVAGGRFELPTFGL